MRINIKDLFFIEGRRLEIRNYYFNKDNLLISFGGMHIAIIGVLDGVVFLCCGVGKK